MRTERKIYVIGAGILGAACAARLARAGHAVTILDEQRPENQASSGSLVWLNVSSTADSDYARLRAASLALWREMSAEPGAPIDWRGTILWNDDGREMSAEAQMLTALGLPAQPIGKTEMQALVPGLAAPFPNALHVPGEGVVDPRRVTDWMLERAKAAGARLRPARVAALTRTGDAITGVTLDDGETLTADETILAAGRATPALLAPLGVAIPLKPAPGGLVITSPAPPRVAPVLATPWLDFWQAADGRFLIGTSPGATLEAAARATDHALTELAKIVPACTDVAVEQVILRERPVPGDGLPAMGRIDGVDGLFAAVTHSGMTLAPIIAEAACAAITGAAPPLDLARYRLTRF